MLPLQTIQIDNHTYTIGKLTPMAQFHVLRRLAPVLAEMGVSMEKLEAGKNADVLDLLAGASRVVAEMSNEDVEYVIHTCLAVVQRAQEGARGQPILTGKQFQFQDIGMDLMLRLTVEVLRGNLSGFFPQLPAVTSTSGG